MLVLGVYGLWRQFRQHKLSNLKENLGLGLGGIFVCSFAFFSAGYGRVLASSIGITMVGYLFYNAVAFWLPWRKPLPGDLAKSLGEMLMAVIALVAVTALLCSDLTAIRLGNQKLMTRAHVNTPEELLGVLFFGAFLEECAFRGILFMGLKRWFPAKVWLVVLLTALAFASMHTSLLNPARFAQVFFTSVTLNMLSLRHGLWCAIGAHWIANAAISYL